MNNTPDAFNLTRPTFTLKSTVWDHPRSTDVAASSSKLDFIKFHFLFDAKKGVNAVSANLMNHLSADYGPKKNTTDTPIKPTPHDDAQVTTSGADTHVCHYKDYSPKPCNYTDIWGTDSAPSKEWQPLWNNWTGQGAQPVDGQGLSGTNSPDPVDRPWDDFSQGDANNCASIAVIKAAMDKLGDKMYTSKQPDGKNGFNLVLQNGAKINISEDELAQSKKLAQLKGNPSSQGYKEAILAYAVIAKGKSATLKQDFPWVLKKLGDGEHVPSVAHYLGLKVNSISEMEAASADSAIKTGIKIVAPQPSSQSRMDRFGHTDRHALAIDNGKVDFYGKKFDLGQDGFNDSDINYYDLA